MGIEEITEFQFTCTPLFDHSFPIRAMVVYIRARSQEEADEIFMRHAHQFFDQDIQKALTGKFSGYRQTTT